MENLLEGVKEYIDQGMELCSVRGRNKILYGYTHVIDFRCKDGTRATLLYDPIKDKLKLKHRYKVDRVLEKVLRENFVLDDSARQSERR